MNHDPLCLWFQSTEFDTVISCDDCDLIARVRKDERKRASSVVADIVSRSEGINDPGMFSDGTGRQDPSERAYHRGLRDAMNAISGE